MTAPVSAATLGLEMAAVKDHFTLLQFDGHAPGFSDAMMRSSPVAALAMGHSQSGPAPKGASLN